MPFLLTKDNGPVSFKRELLEAKELGEAAAGFAEDFYMELLDRLLSIGPGMPVVDERGHVWTLKEVSAEKVREAFDKKEGRG